MTALTWDKTGERLFETGVDHGVLYLPNSQGVYDTGVAWNGLTGVDEKPTGAESNKQYADNQVYVNLISAEQYEATITAKTYPDEFGQCNGEVSPQPGFTIGQQSRKPFGFSYRTLLGNDLANTDYGYKLHLVYGCQAAPSERNYQTVNDSPEAIDFSWDITTTPIEVPGYKPAATFTIDSTQVDADALSALEDALYGTAGTDPQLPTPAALLAFFAGTITTVTPTAPTYDSGTHTITIPTVTGVDYTINDEVATGAVVITEDTLVKASPQPGYRFPDVVDTEWVFTYSA